MAKFFVGILVLVLSVTFPGISQDMTIHPKAIADKDSIKIGEPFSVSVFVDYPFDYQLLFPDSSFQFGNCILKERRFFPTRTRNEISRDCVVYQLACFNPEPLQSFQIPVIRYSNGDSIRYPSGEIRFVMVSETDSTGKAAAQFLNETSPAAIALRLNYPYIIGIFSLVVLLLLIANFFFDKPIQKFFYLWIERRRHQRFLKAFTRMGAGLEKDLSIQKMEALIVLWKRYLQRLDGQPFLSYTSMEIVRVLPDPKLKNALQEVDRWIYGGMEMKELQSCVSILQEKSVAMYELKREQIRNGKLGKAF